MFRPETREQEIKQPTRPPSLEALPAAHTRVNDVEFAAESHSLTGEDVHNRSSTAENYQLCTSKLLDLDLIHFYCKCIGENVCKVCGCDRARGTFKHPKI